MVHLLSKGFIWLSTHTVQWVIWLSNTAWISIHSGPCICFLYTSCRCLEQKIVFYIKIFMNYQKLWWRNYFWSWKILQRVSTLRCMRTKKIQPEGEEWGYRCEALVVGGGRWGVEFGWRGEHTILQKRWDQTSNIQTVLSRDYSLLLFLDKFR